MHLFSTNSHKTTFSLEQMHPQSLVLKEQKYHLYGVSEPSPQAQILFFFYHYSQVD